MLNDKEGIFLKKMSKSINLEVVRSETDIFSEPEMDISLNSSGMFEYHPLATISQSGGPISF